MGCPRFTSWQLSGNLLQWFLLFMMISGAESARKAVSATQFDRLALLDFKNRITRDPLGIMASWNDSVHFCIWPGVSCDPSSERVVVLDLEAQRLAGQIPPSAGNLTFLTGINLINNSFGGEIPQEIGRLDRLQHLNLSLNSFSGKIPTNLTHLKELRVLNLGLNQLEGQIPEQLSSLSKLVRLNLGSNNLTGRIPAWIGNLSSLQRVILSVNNFEGTIPKELGRLSNLGFLQLYGNYLSGTVPSSIYNISSLYFVTFAQNKLHGQIPPDIGLTLPNLEVFAGGVNNFTGPIPASLSNATRLGLFDFAQNTLTGHVSISLGSLPGLYWLNLDDNMLGSGQPGDLRFIDFLVNCSGLEVLGLGGNRFGGELPSSIANLSTQLRRFTIGRNMIQGSVPVGIGNLVKLSLLGLEWNFLTGSVPDVLGKLQYVEALHLNFNRFSGPIPASLGNLTALTRLFMEENRFEGAIPPTLGNCHELLVMNLSSNNLSGVIPRPVLSLSSLSISLSLSHNFLTGSLPPEVSNLKNLGELDISENKLSGPIPSSLGSCISLQRLYLRGNTFEGTIPPSFSSLRGLEEIDLSHNNLSGQIPEFFGQISPLKLLNLSYNNLEGQVSRKGIYSNASAVFVIGNHKLCGGVPDLHLAPCSVRSTVKSSRRHLVILLTIASVLVVLLFCSLVIWYLVKGSRKMLLPFSSKEWKLLGMSYSELLKATDGFSSANLVGSGSFGSVYRGFIPGGGKAIAVKVLNLEKHGALDSFNDECHALRSVRHRNLLKIITACSSIDHQGNDFKALVFEFMPNGSLDQWLHPTAGMKNQTKKLGFLRRLDIAIGIASALEYLHHHCETPLVHCDLKPSNILLDEDMTAHVADFGLARFLFEASDELNTLSSVLKGSIGYIPPEYGMGGQVSVQGDVYSYGVLLLEMFTGKRPTDEMFNEGLSIHHFVTTALPEHVMNIIDPSMFLEVKEAEEDDEDRIEENVLTKNRCDWQAVDAGGSIEECLVSVMKIGLFCSATAPSERMAMNIVVNNLLAIRDSFQKLNN